MQEQLKQAKPDAVERLQRVGSKPTGPSEENFIGSRPVVSHGRCGLVKKESPMARREGLKLLPDLFSDPRGAFPISRLVIQMDT